MRSLRQILLGVSWFLLWHICAIAQNLTEPRIALVIANSDYETTGWDLANPTNDAVLISNALREVGFEVHMVTDAGRYEMEVAFQAHGERLAAAGPRATGFFFYAGHGVQSEGLNYLVPADARAQTEADIWAQAPRLENLFRNLRRAGNARNFVVLDACRNNPLLSSTRNVSSGLATMSEASGTLIAYATAPGAVAEDGAGNSPYTKALADLITEPGVPVESLFRRVRTQVSAETNNRQRPWMESGLSGYNDFCFAGCFRPPTPASGHSVVPQLSSNPPDLQKSHIIRLQAALANDGFYEGDLHGSLSEETLTAISHFSAFSGYGVDQTQLRTTNSNSIEDIVQFIDTWQRPTAYIPENSEESERIVERFEGPNGQGGVIETVQVSIPDRVYFAPGSYTLTEFSKSTLQRQADWLKSYPEVNVSAQGNVSEGDGGFSTLSDEEEYTLGELRARAVTHFLISLGVAADRIETVSNGGLYPTAGSDDPERIRKNANVLTQIIPGTD